MSSTNVVAFPAPRDADLSRTVIRNVKAEMARRGVTQAQMAAALGISQQAMSDRLRVRVQLTVSDMGRLATLLGVTPASLCAIRDSNPEPADSCHPFLAQVIDLASRRAS